MKVTNAHQMMRKEGILFITMSDQNFEEDIEAEVDFEGELRSALEELQ